MLLMRMGVGLPKRGSAAIREREAGILDFLSDEIQARDKRPSG
ncbi:hypothetical protein [Parasphingorhabdus sp.]